MQGLSMQSRSWWRSYLCSGRWATPSWGSRRSRCLRPGPRPSAPSCLLRPWSPSARPGERFCSWPDLKRGDTDEGPTIISRSPPTEKQSGQINLTAAQENFSCESFVSNPHFKSNFYDWNSGKKLESTKLG